MTNIIEVFCVGMFFGALLSIIMIVLFLGDRW